MTDHKTPHHPYCKERLLCHCDLLRDYDQWLSEQPKSTPTSIESKDFWKDIIYKDGKLDEEQILEELEDYHFILEQLPKIYYHITGGKLSKVFYSAETIISESDDYTNKIVEEAIEDYKEEQSQSTPTLQELDEIKLYSLIMDYTRLHSDIPCSEYVEGLVKKIRGKFGTKIEPSKEVTEENK